MVEPLQVIADEVHYYEDGIMFYPFNNRRQSEYIILHIWGWVNRIGIDHGPTRYSFVLGTDYELFNDGVRWLGNFTPIPPPSYMGISKTPFYVSYAFKIDLSKQIRSCLYPFVREGLATGWVDGIAVQANKILQEGLNIQSARSILRSGGDELDLLSAWFNRERLPGESDESYRSRNINFELYFSSGTKTAIADVIEAYTGVRPEIVELWQQTSYWNYNPNDPSIVYYWASRDHPELNQEPIFRWWSYTYQLSTFYVIMDLDMINNYGISAIKRLIDNAKAAGVAGYLGYLVDETFENGNDDHWEPQTNVKGESSTPADWAVDGTFLNYVYTSTGSHSGMSVVDDVYHIGSDTWNDYMISAYCMNASSSDSDDIKVGLVTRWNEITDEFYFFGMCTNNNSYYIYKFQGGPTWQLIASGNTDVEGNSLVFNKDQSYHFRVVMGKSGANLYIDNVLVYTSTSAFNELTTGRVGFAAITASSTPIVGAFDDMTVVV
jgi:hypothetical protein